MQIARIVAGLAARIFVARAIVRRIAVLDAVEAAALFAEARDADRQGVVDRNIDRALQIAVVVIAELRLA